MRLAQLALLPAVLGLATLQGALSAPNPQAAPAAPAPSEPTGAPGTPNSPQPPSNSTGNQPPPQPPPFPPFPPYPQPQPQPPPYPPPPQPPLPPLPPQPPQPRPPQPPQPPFPPQPPQPPQPQPPFPPQPPQPRPPQPPQPPFPPQPPQPPQPRPPQPPQPPFPPQPPQPRPPQPPQPPFPPQPPQPPQPPRSPYHVLRTLSGGAKDGLYVVGYPSRQNMYDLVLTNDRGRATRAVMMGSYEQFLIDGNAFGLVAFPSPYLQWGELLMILGQGSPGWSFNFAGQLVYGNDPPFSFLACDWWHGEPQLFYASPGARSIPTCARVALQRELA